MLGSIIPSSRFLTARLLGQMDWAHARLIVEYGPGVGTFTREILRRMRPDAVLIAIEMNPEFVGFLRDTVPDPRLRVVHGSAAEVRQVLVGLGNTPADYIISGIPLSTLALPAREEILRTSRDSLGPGGAFLVYQFSPRVLPDLRRVFTRVQWSFEPFNVLPAQLFYCRP